MLPPFGFGSTSLFGPTQAGSMLSALMDAPMRPGMSSYSSMSHAIGQNGQWVSQSQVQRTINGRTETITTRRDAQVSIYPGILSELFTHNVTLQGNEHVTYSSPEGERYTINGVEQPRDHALPSASKPPEPPKSSRPAPPPAITAPPPVSTKHVYQNQTQPPFTSTYVAAPPVPTQTYPQAQAQAQQYSYPAPSYAPPPNPESHRSSHHNHRTSKDYYPGRTLLLCSL